MKSLCCRHLFLTSLLVLLVGTGVHAQVLDQVPSTALAVLKVKSLSATNAKVVKMAKAFGLDQFSPDLADPLSSMVQKLHISEGLNKSGEMAFVIFDKDAAQAKQDDSMLVLVPVSDYKAFLGNLKDVKEEGGIAEGKSQEGDKEVFVAHWGDYAAMSPAKALVATKPAETMKLSGLAAKESDKKDVVLLANMETLRAVILPKLKSERGKILDEVSKSVGKDEAAKKFIPVARAMISVYLDGVESFLSAATSGVIGLDLGDDGIGTTFLAEFKPDSDWGRTAAELKGEAGGKSLLAGLPDRKYYAFAGYAADPKVMKRILAMVIDPIVKELNDAGEVGKQMADLLQSDKALYGAVHRVAAGFVVADGALGQESVFQIVAVAHGDAKEIKQAFGGLIKGASGVSGAAPQDSPAKMAVEFKPDAKTIDGVTFDTYDASIKTDPNDPKAAQAQQISAMVFGANGLSGVVGAVDDKTVLFVHGGTDKLISAAIAASKDPQDRLSDLPGVKSVSSHLPENRYVEYYVRLDQVVSSAVKYAAGLGFPLKLRIPPNLPPIGLAAATDGPAVRVDSFIPSQLVESLVAAGIEAYTNIQGGPGGSGGPGGL